ncbi:MAG: N-glycosylase/DNA lyase [Candidatus Cloacimonadota bacterium]|nr:N-glycosylase/DNA lyase [Candidatus Cloacimonadota bacterium]
MKNNNLEKLKQIYWGIKDKIEARLNEFSEVWINGNDADIFAELVFCILTPQSKAKSCWKAVKSLIEKNLLFNGDKNQIAKELNGVRFQNNKSRYIIEARKKYIKSLKFLKSDIDTLVRREWLARNIKGFGYKEASHFLRNIGFGEDLAILDRHILKNLKLLKLIDEIPKVLSKKKYLEIEERMKKFSEDVKIPMSHLDLVWWYKETGKVFK